MDRRLEDPVIEARRIAPCRLDQRFSQPAPAVRPRRAPELHESQDAPAVVSYKARGKHRSSFGPEPLRFSEQSAQDRRASLVVGRKRLELRSEALSVGQIASMTGLGLLDLLRRAPCTLGKADKRSPDLTATPRRHATPPESLRSRLLEGSRDYGTKPAQRKEKGSRISESSSEILCF
jgi:hypothetical protein